MPLLGTEARETRAQGLVALLHRIAAVANRASGFNEALSGVTQEVCSYTGWCAGHALVVKTDAPGGPRLISAGNWHFSGPVRLGGLRRRASLETFAPGEDLPGTVWLRREAIEVENPHTADRRFARLRGLPVRRWFGFPVISLDRAEGVVEFGTVEDIPMHADVVAVADIVGSMLGYAFMRERLGFFKMAIDNAQDAITVYRVTNDAASPLKIAYVSPSFEQQTGYSASEAQDQPKQILHGPETDAAHAQSLVQRVLGGEPVQADVLKYRKDGSTFWAHITMRPFTDSQGNVQYVVAVQRDITERKRWEQQLELLSTALRQANDMIAMFERGGDDRWRIWYVNDLFVRTSGYAREEVLGHDSTFMEGPQTDRTMLREFRDALIRGHPYRGEVAYYKKDGTVFWVDLNGRPIVGRDGETTHSIVLYHDITEARERAEILSHQASHDPLTGLRNRRYFSYAMEEALRASPDIEHRHALLFLDLDGFKAINDRYGHSAGDRVLSAIAERLRISMREGDVLARLGGDEFAVLLHDCSPDSALRVARHLLDAVQSLRVPWNESEALSVGLSIGIAPCAPGEKSPDEALHEADAACYAAKKLGGNRAEFAQVVA
jgi:diguanylate cyclase (GGDEF)-like protein/PAS domain S-box-containing protein